jgi:mannosyltransferase OCH1-like enzyme
MPERWMRTWRDAHPTWSYRAWRDEDVDAFGLSNERLYRRCRTDGLFDAAADVVRAEILLREGGVYVDADSVCLRALDGAAFLDAGFFAAIEPEALVEDLISNAFIGAQRDHPVLRRYVDALTTVDEPRPQWRRTGPLQLTAAVRAGSESDVKILPAWTFFTSTLRGESVTGGAAYAEHYFSSTAERAAYPGARRYPE